MSHQEQGVTFDEASEKRGKNEAVVHLGRGRGYKVIHKEDWKQ